METQKTITNIRDYLENREIARYMKEGIGLTNSMLDMTICKEDRANSKFNDRVLAGYNIMTNNLHYGVMGNRTSRREFINFVDRNLRQKSSELKASDVVMSLKNHDGAITLSQELLESESIYIFDFLNILRESDQAVDDMYFFCWGVARIDWDSRAEGGRNWITGMPTISIRDPRNIYLNPGVKSATLKDKTMVFDIERYRTEELRRLLEAEGKKDIADRITKSISDIVYAEGNDTATQIALSDEFSTVDVAIQQYELSDITHERVIVNNDDGEVTNWLEEDYQNYLREVYNNLVQSDSMDLYFTQLEGILEVDLELPIQERQFEYHEQLRTALDGYALAEAQYEKKFALEILDMLAQENEENEVFPEKVVATKKREVMRRYWYEVKFIPQLTLLIQEPKILNTCTYIFYPGDRDPDFSYPISPAWKHSNLLEIYSTLLTKQLLYSIKFDKPQIVIIPGAIANEDEFREHGYNPNFAVIETAGWRQNGNYPPDQKPFYYIYPQEVGRMAQILEQKLEAAIDAGLRSTPVMRGESDFAGESGKSVVQKTINAKTGDKTDLFKLSEFYRHLYEVFKWMIPIYKEGVPHETSHLNENNEKDMVPVNTNDENQLIDAMDSCFVEVKVMDDADAIATQRKNEAIMMLDKGIATKIDTLRDMDPPNIEARIKNLKAQDIGIQLQEAIAELPEEQQQGIIQQVLQLGQQAQEETDNPE